MSDIGSRHQRDEQSPEGGDRSKRPRLDRDAELVSSETPRQQSPEQQHRDEGSRQSQPASSKYSNLSQEQLIEMINEKDEVIKDKDKVIKDKDKVIKDKDKVIKENDRSHKNHSFESLMAVQEGKLKLNSWSVSSNTYGNYMKASSREVDLKLCDPNPQKLKRMNHVSRLLLHFVDQDNLADDDLQFKKVTYGSEADVARIIRDAVSDAITILEFEGHVQRDELDARLERSLFGCRPDILVVRDKTRVGLVSIEVKQPSKLQLTDYPSVLGQAYDQAQAMNAFGQGAAIVLITSFEESYVCSSIASDFQDIGEEKLFSPSRSESGNSPQEMSQTQSPRYESPNHLRTVSSEAHSSASSNESTPHKERGSSQRQTTISKQENSSLFTKEGDEQRVLYRSRAYKPHELVKAIYNAIRIAKLKYKESTAVISKLSLEERYKFPRALRAVRTEKKYCWGELDVKLGETITSVKQKPRRQGLRVRSDPLDTKDPDSYYIIGVLGHGRTSNVFHALDSKGREVAIKVYVNYFDDNGQTLNTNEFSEKAKAATTKEARLLREFYPFLKEQVKTAQLFDRFCVVMPLFKFVERAKRGETLTEIGKVLSGPFKKRKLVYREDDVRWRHVGKFEDAEGIEHCVLFDLANLEKVKSGEFSDRVGSCISALTKLMNSEKKSSTEVFASKEKIL